MSGLAWVAFNLGQAFEMAPLRGDYGLPSCSVILAQCASSMLAYLEEGHLL
jgi:hypothetical protein